MKSARYKSLHYVIFSTFNRTQGI